MEVGSTDSVFMWKFEVVPRAKAPRHEGEWKNESKAPLILKFYSRCAQAALPPNKEPLVPTE
jgi:hypothetical protein